MSGFGWKTPTAQREIAPMLKKSNMGWRGNKAFPVAHFDRGGVVSNAPPNQIFPTDPNNTVQLPGGQPIPLNQPFPGSPVGGNPPAGLPNQFVAPAPGDPGPGIGGLPGSGSGQGGVGMPAPTQFGNPDTNPFGFLNAPSGEHPPPQFLGPPVPAGGQPGAQVPGVPIQNWRQRGGIRGFSEGGVVTQDSNVNALQQYLSAMRKNGINYQPPPDDGMLDPKSLKGWASNAGAKRV